MRQVGAEYEKKMLTEFHQIMYVARNCRHALDHNHMR